MKAQSGPLWRDYAAFLAGMFPGKMQKIAVNAGFSCPNRDGTLGRGGCIYCANSSFTPGYCSGARSVTEQLEEGKRFFARKYPSMRYLAYFQAYTSTHAADTGRLMELYAEALEVEGMDGLIIATRPDCMPQQLLDSLAGLPKRVIVEYGAETSHDVTLSRINRCHTAAATEDAVRRTAEAGLPVGLHLINGLPGETEQMMLETVDWVNRQRVATVKFHHLQTLRGTTLERLDPPDAVSFTPESYARLCAEIVERLRPDIAIDRFLAQAPPEMVVKPRWGLKNYQFTHMVERQLLTMRQSER
ncbi:MAG: TIGR01212 family radical SAM protein [Bacteroides sp.]|nr:TIGR01212 family radical SAM protein [Bacteroides sp.]